MKKIINIIYLLIISLFIIDVFSLVNIEISRKYEVDLLSTDYELSHLNKDSIYTRQNELDLEESNCKIRIIIYISIVLLEYAYEKQNNLKK